MGAYLKPKMASSRCFHSNKTSQSSLLRASGGRVCLCLVASPVATEVDATPSAVSDWLWWTSLLYHRPPPPSLYPTLPKCSHNQDRTAHQGWRIPILLLDGAAINCQGRFTTCVSVWGASWREVGSSDETWAGAAVKKRRKRKDEDEWMAVVCSKYVLAFKQIAFPKSRMLKRVKEGNDVKYGPRQWESVRRRQEGNRTGAGVVAVGLCIA